MCVLEAFVSSPLSLHSPVATSSLLPPHPFCLPLPQSLCFLVRDWNCPYEHAYGLVGGLGYLEEVLQVIKCVFGCFKEPFEYKPLQFWAECYLVMSTRMLNII